MRAAVRHRYGPPENLAISELPKPTPGAHEVLIQIQAVSLNASDAESLTGSPAYARIFGLFTPRFPVLGTDVAGRVAEVGTKVKAFRPGDAVFGDILGCNGALAEFACAPEKLLRRMPANLSFLEAAALPQAGMVALQGVRDKGRAGPGQKVLVNGGGGGSGTFAVQIARHLGAEVTGVDSASKLELMRSLGAHHVLDYAANDITQLGERYDLILDLVGSHPLGVFRRMLTPSGRYLVVGGPMKRILSALCWGPWLSLGKQSLGLLAVMPNRGLEDLASLVEQRQVRPAIDRIVPLEDAREALRAVLEGKALGKVVVRVAEAADARPTRADQFDPDPTKPALTAAESLSSSSSAAEDGTQSSRVTR